MNQQLEIRKHDTCFAQDELVERWRQKVSSFLFIEFFLNHNKVLLVTMSSTEQLRMPELRVAVSRGQRLLSYTDEGLRPAAYVVAQAWALYDARSDGHWNSIGDGAKFI